MIAESVERMWVGDLKMQKPHLGKCRWCTQSQIAQGRHVMLASAASTALVGRRRLTRKSNVRRRRAQPGVAVLQKPWRMLAGAGRPALLCLAAVFSGAIDRGQRGKAKLEIRNLIFQTGNQTLETRNWKRKDGDSPDRVPRGGMPIGILAGMG
jgi:hypothetical protein